MSAFEWNLFEDPEAVIREGGWLKLIKGHQVIPDDYGVAFVLPHKDLAVCAPLPWHTVYGWAYRAYWRWRIAAGCSLAKDALSRAFDKGMEIQRKHAEDRIAFLTSQHQMELGLREAAAEHRGRQEMTSILESLIDAEFPHGRGGKTH